MDYHEHWTRQPQCTSESLATGTGIPFVMPISCGFAVYTVTPYQIPQGPSPQCPTPNQSSLDVALRVSCSSLRSFVSSADVCGGSPSLQAQGLWTLGFRLRVKTLLVDCKYHSTTDKKLKRTLWDPWSVISTAGVRVYNMPQIKLAARLNVTSGVTGVS